MQRAVWVLVGCAVLAAAVWLIQPGARSEDKKQEKGTVVEIDGLSSRTPADWKEEKPKNNLRIKQFRLPKADGDKDDADLGISHVPAGGSLEENIKRWKGMFACSSTRR